MTGTWSGTINGLLITRGIGAAAARYEFGFEDNGSVPLNERIGQGMTIEFEGAIVCRYCGRVGQRSFGGGYCYDCFKTLARCDLCVVSPDRCHYHEGTCREPEWGESFCMQPHRVYLANSSGIKVGITRRGREVGRWLDQGAIQGLGILEAVTRRAAGLAEASIATQLPDRTDWRKMLRADVPELDLFAAVETLERATLDLPEGVGWAVAERVERLHYPLPANGFPSRSIKLENGPVAGNLLGMKGQYLVLSSGAFNVRHYAGYQVTVSFGAPFDALHAGAEQLGLF